MAQLSREIQDEQQLLAVAISDTDELLDRWKKAKPPNTYRYHHELVTLWIEKTNEHYGLLVRGLDESLLEVNAGSLNWDASTAHFNAADYALEEMNALALRVNLEIECVSRLWMSCDQGPYYFLQ